ncbi:MAG: acyl-CoA synthetase [Parvibaculaceae bacterium]
MHPSVHSETHPDKPACIMASTSETITYGELDKRSNQLAHLFRAHGLRRGDAIALCLENVPNYYEIVWGAQRSGLYCTCVSSKLTSGEIEYILTDSGAKLFISSASLKDVALGAVANLPAISCFMMGGAGAPFESYEAAILHLPTTPVADQSPGTLMLYSSGTTGRPKGVKRTLPEGPIVQTDMVTEFSRLAYGIDEKSVYLVPAPLYHAAPLGWSMAVQRLGATVIVMEHFDAEQALALIERYKVTHAQFVPTHFVRMLKLPDAVRQKYDLSSLKVAIHAAAPCPVPTKEKMLEWWGPVIYEYYAGTEGNGLVAVTPEEWITKKGTVGRAMGASEVKVCDEDGNPLPARSEGTIYFAGGASFEYHNDSEKTASSRNQHGWTTLGDVGYLDEDGYLFLTDRKSFMIISGGVNIYPQEIENLLVTHPKVADAAVIGAPDEEMGEKVIAVIQPMNWDEAGEELAAELKAYIRSQLSGVKTPRQIDFRAELPRHATGKLYKRLIRDEYWGKKDSRIV